MVRGRRRGHIGGLGSGRDCGLVSLKTISMGNKAHFADRTLPKNTSWTSSALISGTLEMAAVRSEWKFNEIDEAVRTLDCM